MAPNSKIEKQGEVLWDNMVLENKSPHFLRRVSFLRFAVRVYVENRIWKLPVRKANIRKKRSALYQMSRPTISCTRK